MEFLCTQTQCTWPWMHTAYTNTTLLYTHRAQSTQASQSPAVDYTVQHTFLPPCRDYSTLWQPLRDHNGSRPYMLRASPLRTKGGNSTPHQSHGSILGRECKQNAIHTRVIEPHTQIHLEPTTYFGPALMTGHDSVVHCSVMVPYSMLIWLKKSTAAGVEKSNYHS